MNALFAEVEAQMTTRSGNVLALMFDSELQLAGVWDDAGLTWTFANHGAWYALAHEGPVSIRPKFSDGASHPFAVAEVEGVEMTAPPPRRVQVSRPSKGKWRAAP